MDITGASNEVASSASVTTPSLCCGIGWRPWTRPKASPLTTPGWLLSVLCLNAPELDTAFLHAQVAQAAPGLHFVERLANPAAFADSDPEKSLKVLHYQNA